MVKRSRGTLSRQTKKLKRRRKLTVSDYVKTFEVGQRVVITPQPLTKGMPHPRYKGRHGVIVDRRGKAYVVEVKDFSKIKQLIVLPVHLSAF